MNFLSLMSGPLMALARYGVTAAAGAVVARGYVDGATAQTIGAGLLAAVAAGIGALTSTKTAAIAKAADVPGAKVTLPNGKTVASASAAQDAIAHDPTWDNPNAR